MMKSKSKLVRILLLFQPFIKQIWLITPAFISKFFLKFFRNSDLTIGYIIRYLCICKLSQECGEKVIIFPGVFFKNLQNISFGTNVSIHEMCYLEGYGGITIGNDVAIGHSCSIISSDHDVDNIKTSMKDAKIVDGQIIIDSDVWLGAGVKILKNVHIREHAVIGAGAVVTTDIAPWSISVGIPARHLRYRQHQNDSLE